MDRPVPDIGSERRTRNNLAVAFALAPQQVHRVILRCRRLALGICLRSASCRSHWPAPQINGFSVRERRQSQPTQSSPRQWATFSVNVSARAPCSRSARPPHPSSVGSTPNRSLAHQPSVAAALPCVNASQRTSSTMTRHRSAGTPCTPLFGSSSPRREIQQASSQAPIGEIGEIGDFPFKPIPSQKLKSLKI